jgi:murein L,D-transpeptidase YafK
MPLRRKRIHGLVLPLCALILVSLTSCTVQNSASPVENRGVGDPKQHVGQSGAVVNSSPSGTSRMLKADYLKPLHDIRNASVLVQKEKRRLYVFAQDVLVREYPVGLGRSPAGDKDKGDDGKTPEGEFYICGKKSGEALRKVMIISYPSRKHAERAHFQGALPLSGVRNIISAVQNGLQPPWDTPLGGNIGIHGGGAHDDWTNGSVALYDSDMSELYTIAQLGTPVHIRP